MSVVAGLCVGGAGGVVEGLVALENARTLKMWNKIPKGFILASFQALTGCFFSFLLTTYEIITLFVGLGVYMLLIKEAKAFPLINIKT